MKRCFGAVVVCAASLLCAVETLGQRQTVITGNFVGHDGTPMLKAHVHLTRFNQREPTISSEVSPHGVFRIATSEAGLLLVQFTGVDHSRQEVPIYIEKPGRIKINVRLRINEYRNDFSNVKITGDFNNASSQSAQPMLKLSDGTFVAEFETDAKQFAYQLSGVRKSGGTVNGTQSEDYNYDGGGDYRSVVTPRNRYVRIVFDPNKLVRSSADAQIRFIPEHSKDARLAQIYNQMLQRRRPLSMALAAHKKSGKPAYEFRFD